MNDSIEAIKDLGISIEALSLKTKGQTSNTFIGKYEGKKIVVKIFTEVALKKMNHDFLSIDFNQLSEQKLFPNIIHISAKKDFLIYEYFNSLSYKVDRDFIEQLGSKIKELHKIKSKLPIKSFLQQVNKYKNELVDGDNKHIFEDLYFLLNEYKTEINDLVFSHNDLNITNVLINKDICFIDYDYVSLNNKYCDLARVIDEFNLNDKQTQFLMNSYGNEDNIGVASKIETWKKINAYLDYIWILFLQKKGLIKKHSSQHTQYLSKINKITYNNFL